MESASGTFSWALEDVLDRFGNGVAYTYQKDGGEPYLVQIDYNLRPGAAENRVVLEYQPRPDPIEDGRAGFLARTSPSSMASKTGSRSSPR